jgi:DNA repair exonuclease SbcCD ATPase subunit
MGARAGGEGERGDRSVGAHGAAGGLRALLKEAAQARRSTLEYFEANPSECSPEARRRASQAHAEARPSAAAPQRLSSRLVDEPPAPAAPDGGSPASAPPATPVSVVALGGRRRSAASPQTAERGGTAEPQDSDVELLREQLLESQAEVRRLQGALDAEQGATRRLAAELRDADDECDSLRSKLSALEAQLAQQAQLAREAHEALELQQSAVADAEALAEELEAAHDKLAASERVLSASGRQDTALQKELEDALDKLAASERQQTALQKERGTMQIEYDGIIDQLQRELAESEAALEKVRADGDRATLNLRDELERVRSKSEDSQSTLRHDASVELRDLEAQVAALAEANAQLEAALADATAQAADVDTDADRAQAASRPLKSMVAPGCVLVDAELLASMCARAGSSASLRTRVARLPGAHERGQEDVCVCQSEAMGVCGVAPSQGWGSEGVGAAVHESRRGGRGEQRGRRGPRCSARGQW